MKELNLDSANKRLRTACSTTPAPGYVQDPVAVVGLACRLPGNSNSPTAFWEFLARGGCAENEPPSSRFNLKGHFDGSMKPGTMRSPGGMFLENINPKDIDARFFALSKADAISMDPQQRQLLEVVYEGLENAGISLDMLKGQAYSCFVGSYASDYSDIQARDPEDRTPSFTVGSGRAMLSNRISHFLDIKGPSMTIDTACSGSLISIDLACRYLQTRDTDGAIVAACNLYMNPEHNMDQSAIRASASPTGRCHTFDAKADGYIKAEAVNMVILKRLDDALRDRDSIRAIIRGSSTNSDGRTPGIASPSSEAQAAAIRKAYARAGISDFQNTSYLECHGTGTQAGDPIEVDGVASVFSDCRAADHPLIIGSVKSNIGHSEPAAGISGLLKTVLALENGVIPGNPTFETPNPKIDFHTLNVRASKATIPWPDVPFRRASVNSFGYGGSNAHVILDETHGFLRNHKTNYVSSYASDIDNFFVDEFKDTERPRVLLFSANDDISLKSYSKAMTRHLINPGVSINLRDLAYTLSERRTHHFHRAYVLATGTNLNQRSFKYGKICPHIPRLGFVFTGQGAQWSQMGKSLVETFSVGRLVLRHLDDVLQSLPDPPEWSLLDELVEPRTPEHLRLPEISQPLVTALQLAILAILSSWGLHPRSVVGHSSGEIAAAAAAGYLTEDEAIKVAYYRGKAAVGCQNGKETDSGMLAIGLGQEDIQTYMTSASGFVQIACVNSPNSVTLSGKISYLELVKAKVQADGHFARILQVNLPYHSQFMTEIAIHYEKFLLDHCEPQVSGHRDIAMFSSVTGRRMEGECSSSYWHNNMVSPVLFQQALEQMINEEGADFLIELGPSGALSGPIAQIKKGLGAQGAAVQYYATSKRGTDSVNAMFDLAGRVFLSGGSINMFKVNEDEDTSDEPLIIVDLPNYTWNHSTQYWHESEASKDWRFKIFPSHDLIGSKIMGTSWHTPSWKKILRVSDVPWLKDHQIGEDIIFPAAGYMAMAMEALYQTGRSLGHIDETTMVSNISYRLRNVSFLRAMVLEEGVDHKIFLALVPCAGPKDSWHEFRISSVREDMWTEHCRGLIRLQRSDGEGKRLSVGCGCCVVVNEVTVAPKDALEPLKYSVPAQSWYKALGDVGYNFGPLFQKQIEIESIAGRRYSRVLLSFSDPESAFTQSCYPMHPVCIDGCLQSGVPSLWQGYRSSIDTPLVPAIIDDLVIRSSSAQPETGIAVTTSEYIGTGRLDDAKSFKTHASVYDTKSGSLLLQMSGLSYNKLDTHKDRHGTHTYSQLHWKPDISFLTEGQLHTLTTEQQSSGSTKGGSTSWIQVSYVIDLVAHKKPDLTVMEVDMVSSSHSIWLEPSGLDVACRAACRRYLFTSNTSSGLLTAQEKYQRHTVATFEICNIMKPHEEFTPIGADFDLVIIKLPSMPENNLRNAIKNASKLLRHGGYLLLMHCNLISTGSDPESDSAIKISWEHQNPVDILLSCGFPKVLNISNPFECVASDMFSLAYLCATVTDQNALPDSRPSVSLVNFSSPVDSSEMIRHSLANLGWLVTTHQYTTLDIPAENYVLVIDDISTPVLPTITGDQWKALQNLVNSGRMILWITAGSQFEVSNPQNALFHGFARTARAEDPALILKTLDVESDSKPETLDAINRILLSLKGPNPNKGSENEYCERRGIIHISRVLPDDLVNQAERDSSLGAVPHLKSLHDNPSCVRMQCARPGTMNSLHFSEVSTMEIPLPDDSVEVEIYAAGLNFKDVAIAMGIIPANQDLLGQEGAGVVRRTGKSVASYRVGDRVLVYSKGCFANRVQAPIEGVHLLPDSLSFEEAATLCVVFLTSIIALFDLANTQTGQRVLIHSAAGGVGIAAIQICRYIGAEIYATAGSEEKRQFLTERFDIPPGHIFSSRTTDFAPKLMKATNNKGVDVILNSLVGDLLDESWRCIADRGTMVEISKKDMLDRNALSMEPFARNASYRAIDMSHHSMTRPIVGGLISRMFKMITDGRIKPISPVKIFPSSEIVDAFRYMRSGAHIGKIVISDGPAGDIKVPTRAAPRTLSLRDNVCYVIVGGLKGLCGSLAIYLGRHGAQHLLIMSRSGYQDEKSQAILHNLSAIGTQVNLAKADVSNLEDVRRAFQLSKKPIGGIIQGAMVLRDKTIPSMTVEDFHETIRSKVQGTWNLHSTIMHMKLNLDFFTMLSSISGVIGQKGQANYAAANVFLDSFAAYRHKLGLSACSIDLGVIEDVGYISERRALAGRFERQVMGGINEGLLHKILKFSILQQTSPINKYSAARMITGIAVPQPEDSFLLQDARFGGLCFGDPEGHGTNHRDSSGAVQAFCALIKAKVDHSTLLAGALELVNQQFTKSLGLSEPMEPAKSLSVYGLDSLAAVELRNWVRIEIGSQITTLDILNATSLLTLCEKILAKLNQA